MSRLVSARLKGSCRIRSFRYGSLLLTHEWSDWTDEITSGLTEEALKNSGLYGLVEMKFQEIPEAQPIEKTLSKKEKSSKTEAVEILPSSVEDLPQ